MNKVQLLNNAVCFGSFPPREMPQRRSSRQISKETENGEDHAPRQSSKREAQQWICFMNSEIWSCIGWFGYLITFYRPGCRFTMCTSLSETRWGWKFGLTPLPSLRSNTHKVIREILPYIQARFSFKLGHAKFPTRISCWNTTLY